MKQYIRGASAAIIVLHEIYGINDFIDDQCRAYRAEGYDVYCPNLLNRKTAYSYAQSQTAYRSFIETVGFGAYGRINALAEDLKTKYLTVLAVGFSVGATIAWRCCGESAAFDAVACCYGSRIRDYVSVSPACPALLIFAKRDSFDVASVCARLEGKKNVSVEVMDARHGFVDAYGEHYSAVHARAFDARRAEFFAECQKNGDADTQAAAR